MKTLRLYILILLVSLSSVAFAIRLPSYSFFGANELYAENQDNIEYSVGTKISGINILLSSSNDEWGNECYARTGGEQKSCHECCTDFQNKAEVFDASTVVLYNTCKSICKGGPSLPLGSVLCLLPFAFAYGIYKRYRKNKE